MPHKAFISCTATEAVPLITKLNLKHYTLVRNANKVTIKVESDNFEDVAPVVKENLSRCKDARSASLM